MAWTLDPMDPRWMLRRGRALATALSGRNRAARRRLDGTRGCVLNYHRVIPAEQARRDAVEGGMYVTPESFRMQLEVLRELFTVIPLGEMVDRVLAERPLPPGACAICFDDGWRDNHDHALPELVRAGLPATVFVVTGRVGSDGAFWPDEVCRRLEQLERAQRGELVSSLVGRPGAGDAHALLAHLKSLPEVEREEPLARLRAATPSLAPPGRELMSWDELETLRAAGVAIESHGASHAILTGLDEPGVRSELEGSRRALLERGFGAEGLFAYPSGRHAPALHSRVADAGYRAAFVLDERLVALGAPPMALSRQGVHEGIGRTRLEFLCKIPSRS